MRIHEPGVGLLQPVLALAMASARDWKKDQLLVMIAGLDGKTRQTVKEAELARALGYHMGLLSLAGGADVTEDRLLAHCRSTAEAIPLVGHQVRTPPGTRPLSVEFWRRFADIPNVLGLVTGPYDRYQTLTAVTGVARSARAREVALYTGNDDTIVLDLLTPYVVDANGSKVRREVVGGLLAHWSFWTKRAAEIHRETKKAEHAERIPRSLLTLAGQVTESNAAVLDQTNHFAGRRSGVLHVLERCGLVGGVRTLDGDGGLSAGQSDGIERVIRAYPHLTDDAFVRDHRERWLAR
jgi:hypothetical protein